MILLDRLYFMLDQPSVFISLSDLPVPQFPLCWTNLCACASVIMINFLITGFSNCSQRTKKLSPSAVKKPGTLSQMLCCIVQYRLCFALINKSVRNHINPCCNLLNEEFVVVIVEKLQV